MSGFLARATACALGLGVLLAACQPVDDLEGVADPDGGVANGVADRRGAPATGLPGTVAGLAARGDQEAARWQDGARLAEIAIEVDGGQPVLARLTYVAADADRLLTVTVTADGLRAEQPTLGTFELTPITGAGLDAVPALPDGVQEPAALVEAAAATFAACDVQGEAEGVLYATGAPLSWHPDEQEWTSDLRWTVTLTTTAGGGAVLDPVTGETRGCIG